MPRGSQPIVEAALDLAWSHWTGLGVRGATTAPDSAVDPEALVYLSATLAPHDPRLWDQVTDWWRAFRHHMSRPRLRQLARRFSAAAVRRVTSLDDIAGSSRQPSKARLDDLRHPARALLRMRCAFGDNARAELLLELLTRWRDVREGVTALTLADVGYSKRNVAMVLEDLRLAGVVIASADANRTRYRLADPDALARWTAPIPTVTGQWHVRMPLIAELIVLAERSVGKDPLVQAVEARKLMARQQPSLITLGIDPPKITLAEAYWEGTQRWAVQELLRLPAADGRRLDRMLTGTWIRIDQDVAPMDRPASGVLPRLHSDPAGANELWCLALVQVSTIEPPNDWTWAVLSEAAVGVFPAIDEVRHGRPMRFATRDLGGVRTFVARYGPPLPWPEIARFYGSDAAGRARQDASAVQLMLTRDP